MMQNDIRKKSTQDGFLWKAYMFWVWASWPCAILLSMLYVLSHFGVPVNTAVMFVLQFMSVGVLAALIAIEDRAVKRGRLDLNFWARILNELEYSGC